MHTQQTFKYIIILLYIFSYTAPIRSTLPLYFCTAASHHYFQHLLNLVGSIHKVNFNELKEIAVFDLGMTTEQIAELNTIAKLTVHCIEKTHPDIFTFFSIPGQRPVLGWFAWKMVAIKQALDLFPYVLWLDAGTTVLKPLDHLCSYIQQHGYFLATIGDDISNGKPSHSVGWGTTAYVRTKFNLNTPERSWILNQESIMGGIIGVAQHAAHEFLLPVYELTKDIRNFQDDGTTPNGLGTGRHDQVLLSIWAYSKKLTIFKQDYTQKIPMLLTIDNQRIPLYITWNSEYVCDKTYIYSSRSDLNNINHYKSHIRYKNNA